MNVGEEFAQAVQLHLAGRLDEAAAGYRRVLTVHPRHAESLCNLAGAMLGLGDPNTALQICAQALKVDPHLPDTYCTLSNVLNALNRPSEALAVCQKGLTLAPQETKLFNNMGHALNSLGRLDESLAAYRRALEIQPNFAIALSNAGAVLARLGRLEEAVDNLRRCLKLSPNHVAAAANLAVALSDLARPDEALAAARHTLSLDPRNAAAYNTIGNSLRDAARAEEAISAYRTAAKLNPSDPGIGSNVIYAMEFQPGATDADLLGEQRLWNDVHAAPLRSEWKPHVNDRSGARRLKIGYVSPTFFSHAESFFTVPLIEHHDRAQFEVHCYAVVLNSDSVTQRVRTSVDHWHDCRPYRDDRLAEKVRADQIDILVDLSMHMGKHHLLMFARKPAPVQFTWLAYPGGTGLDAMDFRITDPYLDPPDLPLNGYTEQSIRLDDLWCCYDPLSDASPAAPRENAPIRFGSLNNPCKINDPLVQLWAKLLATIPESTILVQITSEEHRNRVRSIFQSAGVAPNRIKFAGRVPRPEYLRLYDRIDICLDPLPYNGITTSCDAVWMGVPVVTLTGQTAAGRAGAGILAAVGLHDLVTTTPDQFLQTAATLASDRPRLNELRKTLRQTTTKSVLMNASAFARKIESAYRQAWIDWCRGT
jgi:predicted O-linked N-acetylglucosamine transferase (SPINDLY family)